MTVQMHYEVSYVEVADKLNILIENSVFDYDMLLRRKVPWHIKKTFRDI
jgi:hypothetical protein